MLKERNKPLYETLKLFAKETLGILETEIQSGAVVPITSQIAWQSASAKNVFLRRSIDKPEYRILLSTAETLIKSLTIYHKAAEEIKDDDVWGSHIDKMVGSISERTLLSLDSLLMGIPGFILGKTRKTDLSEQAFDEEVERLEYFFQFSTVEHIRITPLYGVRLPNKCFLSNEISIEPLSTDSVLDLLNDGLDPPSFPDHTLHNVFESAIIIRYNLPKLIGYYSKTEEEDTHFIKELFNRLNIDEKIAIDLLSLILDEKIIPLGSVTKSTATMNSRQKSKNEINTPWHLSRKELIKEDQKKLQRLWLAFSNGTINSKHFLVIAIWRFSQAITRPSLEDKLIDLMVCAEALFLSNDGGTELKYKLSHRAALLLGNNPAEKKNIFDFMSDVYNMRSKVVHGSTSYIQNYNNAEQLAQTTTKLAGYLRNAILKMLDIAMVPQASSKLIDWNQFIFEEK